MNNEERRKVIFVALIAMFVTCIPLLYGYLTQDDMYFTGALLPMDSNTYFDYMHQARGGSFLFVNSFTSEGMAPFLFRPLYLTMGLVSILLPSLVVWHGTRIVLGVLLFFAVYTLICNLTTNKHERIVLLLFVILSSGLGWATLLIEQWTGKLYGSLIDFQQSAVTFPLLNGQPHTIASVLFMVLSYLYLLKALSSRRTRDFMIGGGLVALLGFLHPFDLFPLFVIAGITALHMTIKTKKIPWNASLFVIPSLLPILYYGYLSLKHPIFIAWSAQNVVLSPGIKSYLIGYGFIGLLAGLYILSLLRQWPKKKFTSPTVLLLSWLFSIPVFVYIPFKLQARFIEGYHIPLAIAAGLFTLRYVLPVFRTHQMKQHFLTILLIFLSLSNLAWILMTVHSMHSVPTTPFRNSVYLSTDEVELMSMLSEQTGGVVLADYHLSNFVPRYANRRVYQGHWAQTINSLEKQTISDGYLSGAIALPLSLLKESDVTHVIVKKGIHPQVENGLLIEPVYTTPSLVTYQLSEAP